MLGADTIVINGERFTTPTSDAYNPLAWGQQTQGVPNVSPSYPPFMGNPAGSTATAPEGVGGYGTAGNNATVTALANAHPWHIKTSPTLWVIAALVISVGLLWGVHWRPIGGSAHLGEAHAGAEL